MAMTAGPSRKGAIAEINVTPMADVMIVLLIIFMVATPIIARPPVRLPDARHAAEHARGGVEVVVRANGTVTVDGAPANALLLEQLVAARGPSIPAVRVEADRDASYDDVARVLAACRRAGATEVALGARPRLAR
jgi:biopolymer transport protein ExbD